MQAGLVLRNKRKNKGAKEVRKLREIKMIEKLKDDGRRRINVGHKGRRSTCHSGKTSAGTRADESGVMLGPT